MTRTYRLVLLAGLLIFLAGLILSGLQGRFTIPSAGILVVGIAGILLAFLPRLSRNAALYANLILYSAFIVGSLAVLFLIVQRHNVTYDATARKLHTLRPVTKTLLRDRLSENIRVTAFLTDPDAGPAAQLLREYERHSPRFSFRIVNPFRDVAEARRFPAVVPGDLFVEVSTTNTEEISRFRKVTRLNEESLTNAIVELLRNEEIVLYFLTGHDEYPFQPDPMRAVDRRRQTGEHLETLLKLLEGAHIKASPLNVAERNRIPADASAVICVGPQRDFSTAETEALRDYMNRGGRTLILLNPQRRVGATEVVDAQPNLTNLLQEFGLILPREFVALARDGVPNNDRFTIPLSYADHRITQLDQNQPYAFRMVRPVLLSQSLPPQIIGQNFLFSPSDGVRLSEDAVTAAIRTRQALDLESMQVEPGHVPLAAAVTRLRENAAEEEASRLVVFGNGMFVTSDYLTQEGWLLFVNSVNWLTAAGDLIAIPTLEIENTFITLTDGQKQFIFFLAVLTIPSLIGLGGIFFSLIRRESGPRGKA